MSDEAKPPPTCPLCGGDDVKAVVHGYPSGKTLEAAGRGQLELGGCGVAPENPDWRCRSCDHAWPDENLDLPWRPRR